MELAEETEPIDSAVNCEPVDLAPQKEEEYFSPLLRAALTGDTEGIQQIFEDPEDPDHEKATELLMEKDIVGRNLLYATCMAGQSNVVQALSKYGVDLKDKTARGYTLLHCAAAWGQLNTLKTLVELEADIYATTFRGEKARDIASRYEQTECVEFLDWAEAKQNLRMLITLIQATIADPEKVQGRLNKEDKNTSLKTCQAKSDWLENAKEPTIQDFLDQKQQLEDIMLPIFTKLATPLLQGPLFLRDLPAVVRPDIALWSKEHTSTPPSGKKSYQGFSSERERSTPAQESCWECSLVDPTSDTKL